MLLSNRRAVSSTINSCNVLLYRSFMSSTCDMQLIAYDRNLQLHVSEGIVHTINCSSRSYKFCFIDTIQSLRSRSMIIPLVQYEQISAFEVMSKIENIQETIRDLWNGLFLSSTMKKRRAKMNKHKLRKRNKKLRFNTKPSRR